jgi:hypothetical protein
MKTRDYLISPYKDRSGCVLIIALSEHTAE